LVRFQRGFTSAIGHPETAVSIPYWSDFNVDSRRRSATLRLLFQSHITGFNPILVRFQPSSASSSCLLPFNRFNPILVRFQRVNPAVADALHSGRVSIPYWSDFNVDSRRRSATLRLLFQSHIGPISTGDSARVSRAAFWRLYRWGAWFQSHIGPISTKHAARPSASW